MTPARVPPTPLAQASATFWLACSGSGKRDQRGHAFAFGELTAHNVPRSLRRDQNNVHILGRNHGLEMIAKPCENNSVFSLGQIRLDVLLVRGGLFWCPEPHKNNVRLLHRFGRRKKPETPFRATSMDLLPSYSPMMT